MKHPSPSFHTPSVLSLLFLVMLWLGACRALNPVVESDYDRTANFSHYHTYAWHPVEVAVESAINNPIYNPLVDERLKNAVESQLLKKGLTPATTRAPDLLIAYDVSVNTATDPASGNVAATEFGNGFSYWYGYRYNYNHRGVPAFRSIQDYPIGTLIIDFIDPSSNELVWRGWTEGRIKPAIMDESKINRAVARIITQYPPGGSLRQNSHYQGR